MIHLLGNFKKQYNHTLKVQLKKSDIDISILKLKVPVYSRQDLHLKKYHFDNFLEEFEVPL